MGLPESGRQSHKDLKGYLALTQHIVGSNENGRPYVTFLEP
jgi:hypothetical protein